MTDQPTVTVAGHSIGLRVNGYPDIPNRWGSGHIRVDTVRLDYGSNRTPAARHAQLAGLWVREDGEVTDQPIDRYYEAPDGDTSTWPDWLGQLAVAHVPAVPVPPTTHADRAALRDRTAEAVHRAMHPSRSWTRQSDEIREQCFQAADEVLAELPPSASQDSASADEVAHALDNATPYPIELDSALCRFMAERLLEMLTVGKRPEHPVWQPEEQSEPSPCPQPQDPDAVLAVLPEPADETPATEETR